jgi:anti-sigma-K factor RskA
MDNKTSSLQQLLASRRQQIPSDAYFQSVLPELHRRLDRQAVQQPSLWEIICERFQQTLEINNGFALRTVGACAVVALALVAGLNYSWKSGSAPFLTLQDKTLTGASANYLMAEAGDLKLTSSVDQAIDQLSIASISQTLASNKAPARYVLTNLPASYDTVAAF